MSLFRSVPEAILKQYADTFAALDACGLAALPEQIMQMPEASAHVVLPALVDALSEEDLLSLITAISKDRNTASHAGLKHLLPAVFSFITRSIENAGEESAAGTIQFLASLVNICYYQRDYQGIDTCHTLFSRIDDGTVSEGAMIILLFEGLELYRKKYYYDAIRFFDRALQYAKDLNSSSYIGRIYDCMGRAFGDKGRFKEAFEYYELSIAEKKKINDLDGLAISYGNKGRLHLNKSEYDKALECFSYDLEISTTTNDIIGQIIMHSQTGEILWIQKNIEASLEQYQKSLALSQSTSNELGKSFAIMGIINCLVDLKKHDKAEKHIQELEAVLQQNPNPGIEAQLLKVKGKNAERDGNFNLAYDLYKASYTLAEKALPDIEKGLLCERIGVLSLKLNDTMVAQTYLKMAISYLKNTNAIRHLERIQERLKRVNPIEWLLAMFSEFLGKNVIEYITSEKNLTEYTAETASMTVLFSDIRGFTSFSENLSPEDVIETLNEYLNGMATVIENNHGEIDKFIGDAIMAVFPSHPDIQTSALNAVRSAAKMLEEQFMFNTMMQDRKKAPVRTGIGIHTGELITGTMGSNTRKDFTVIGDVVNTASRIEGLSKEYGVSILVSGTVYELTKDEATLHYRYVDTVRAKGKERVIQVYELVKIGAFNDEEKTAMQQHEKAMALYAARNFSGALDIFHSLNSIKEEKIYHIYISRCRAYINEAPPLSWDGAITMQTK